MSDSNIVLSSASYKEIKHFIKEDLDAFKYSFNHLELKKSYSSNSLSNFMLFFNHDFLNYLKECDSSLEIYNKDKFNYRFISNNLDLIKIKIKEFEKIIPTLMVILKKNAVNSKEVKETFNIFKLKLNMDNKLIDKPLIKKLKI